MKNDYDKNDFTLVFPDFLYNMKTLMTDWRLEMSTSKLLQPIKLFYKRNKVKYSIALIFEHKYGKGDEKRKGKTDTARKLFEELGFEVHSYLDLKKS